MSRFVQSTAFVLDVVSGGTAGTALLTFLDRRDEARQEPLERQLFVPAVAKRGWTMIHQDAPAPDRGGLCVSFDKDRGRESFDDDWMLEQTQEHVGNLLFGSLNRYRKVSWCVIAKCLALGLMGGIIVACAVFPLVFLACEWGTTAMGYPQWAQRAAVLISLTWLVVILLLRYASQSNVISLVGDQRTQHFKLGRFTSSADPKLVRLGAFLLIWPPATHAALLWLAPQLVFGENPPHVSLNVALAQSVDNLLPGDWSSLFGSARLADAQAKPWVAGLFSMHRWMWMVLLASLLAWFVHRLWWLRPLYRDLPTEVKNGYADLRDRLHYALQHSCYLDRYPNETVFLVLASNYAAGNMSSAETIARQFPRLAIARDVKVRFASTDGRSLFAPEPHCEPAQREVEARRESLDQPLGTPDKPNKPWNDEEGDAVRKAFDDACEGLKEAMKRPVQNDQEKGENGA